MRFCSRIMLVALFPLLSFALLLLPNPIRAAGEFSVDANVTYNIQETGKTIVTYDYTLENNFSDLYATSNSMTLENIEASNVKAYSSEGTTYPVEVSKDGTITNIKVVFPDDSVGKGVKRHYTVTYENSSFAVRTGEIWEVSIPRVDDVSSYRSYKYNLVIPKGFGLEAYISPKPASSTLTESGYNYSFNAESLSQTGITAGFGQFQVFAFNLSYHLENPLNRNSTTEISLPPDTAFQKVYIQKMDPVPTNVAVDGDGNWIATYDLSPRQRVDVSVVGSVQIFASFRSFPKATDQELNDNLKESAYWQISHPRIVELASQLKTPKAIYDYVSQNLHYDSSRVQPNIQRMGAVAALENPTQAICMEFTDLFIAIARAAGIPAREVNGYAYTENPDLQPLGLVADVLHSWPEYYDRENGVWIPIDPTWGSTTGGVDFFNKLDLRHFAFVIHGESSTQPYPPGSYKLGPNPQKDIFVSFGQLPDNRISIPKVSINPFRVLPFFSSIYTVTVTNPGPIALYSLYPTVYYDNVEKTREAIDVLPPYSNDHIQVILPYSFLGKDTPNIIKVAVGSSHAEILTNKKQVVTTGLLIATGILITIMSIIFLKVKKINLLHIFAKIGTSRKNGDTKPNDQTPQNKIS